MQITHLGHIACQLILRSQVLISLCAMALCLESVLVLGREAQSTSFYAFIFSATLFIYNFYYISANSNFPHKWLSLIAGFSCLCFFFKLPQLPIIPLTIVVLLTLVYIFSDKLKMRILHLKAYHKLMILLLVWFIVTVILPVPSFNWSTQTLCFLLFRFAFLSVLCLLFFIKDEGEASHRNIAFKLASYLLVLNILIAIIIMMWMNTPLGICFLITSLLLILITYLIKQKKRTDLFYHLYVDGMMLLQSIFVFIIWQMKS